MNLSVGQKASRSLTLTPVHIKTYAALTGDYNSLHFDEEFASRTRFGRLVVQSGLPTGLHALVAMDMPSPGTVCLNQDWKFTAQAEILSVHARKPVTQLKVLITRQDGETGLDGEAWCYTFSHG